MNKPSKMPVPQPDFNKEEAKQQRLKRLGNSHQMSMAQYQALLERDKQEASGGWWDSSKEYFEQLRSIQDES